VLRVALRSACMSSVDISWPRFASTRDGLEFLIRPICPDDAERERAFILSLSPESRFQRLMYTLREPSEAFVEQMVHVDHHDTMALVAVVGSGAEERIVGVARYAVDESGEDCEFAIAVSDDWQGRGIGTTLGRDLFEYARREGFRSIYGTILRDNQRMLDLARWLDLEVDSAARGQETVRASYWLRR
jgi:acetyltransferase